MDSLLNFLSCYHNVLSYIVFFLQKSKSESSNGARDGSFLLWLAKLLAAACFPSLPGGAIMPNIFYTEFFLFIAPSGLLREGSPNFESASLGDWEEIF